MTPICFVDTETTSLRHDRRAWEIGIIARTPGRDDAEHQFFVDVDDLDLGNADLQSLRIGRFHERHPQMRAESREDAWRKLETETDLLWKVERITRGAHLVGNVVNFDAEVLAARMREHGITPSWHYHLIDIEALAVGYLAGNRTPAAGLPWDSNELSSALGVVISDEDRHTALGDARWAAAMWDALSLDMTRAGRL